MSARLVADNLDWNQALSLLRLKTTMTGATHMLMSARVQGSFKTPTLRVTRTSVSPERFEIYEH